MVLKSDSFPSLPRHDCNTDAAAVAVAVAEVDADADAEVDAVVIDIEDRG